MVAYMYFIEKSTPSVFPKTGFNIIRWHADNINETICFSHHNHDVLEIISLTSGSLSVECNKKNFNLFCGDIAVFNPYDIHFGSSPGSYDYICLTVNLKTFSGISNIFLDFTSALISGTTKFENFLPGNKTYTKTSKALIDSIFANYSKTNISSILQNLSKIFNLLCILSENALLTSNDKSKKLDRNFLIEVSMYLEENFNKDICTQSICNKLHYEMSHFCHKFKKNFGYSFSNYLNMYRITRACEQYITKNTNISDIAEKVGFSDYCYFSRCFKKYTGISPSRYFSNR